MTGQHGPSEQIRQRILGEFGARGAVVDELLAYDRNVVTERGWPPLPALPLPDEPHVEAWRRYAAEAERDGVYTVLRRTFPQLAFPIRAGISREDEYRAATLRGAAPPALAGGLELRAPGSLELVLHPSVAGTVAILVAGDRADFVVLVQAFCHRNEPLDVPASMGACHIAGLNNWERIHTHRARWETEDPGNREADAWSREFARLRERKELYQDRFIILSRGPYSDVPAADIGMDRAGWLDRSLAIRRGHECTHAFVLRVFGALQNNLLEELVADYAGLLAAFAEYRPELALRFLGLEAFPTYREGGRLQNYRGNPPLSDLAFTVLTSLARAAIHNLAGWDASHPEARSDPAALARSIFVLTGLALEELAATPMSDRAADVFASLGGRAT